MRPAFRRALEWIEEQLNHRRDIAGCMLVALVALPVALHLAIVGLLGLLHPGVAPLFNQDVLRPTLLLNIGAVLLYAGVSAYCWPRFLSGRPHPGLAYGLVTFLLVSSTLMALLYGHLDSPFMVMLFSSFALARVWFPLRVLAPGLVVSLLMLVAVEPLQRQGVLAYAPLLTAPMFTGRPMLPFWDISMQLLMTTAALFFIAVTIYLFALMERRHEALERMAREDTLTGLLNRATFMSVLGEECAKQRRSARPACVMMCDVDHFKQVNDNYGHPAGDLVLARLGGLLRSTTRYPVDVPARYGGEEFVVLLPETDLAAAQVVAERLGDQFRDQVFESEGRYFSVTISIGIAQSADGDGEKALRHADANLYAAKHGGRDRVVASVAA
jgi:diguanylate cyclase (GGDEF)-like protein